MISIRNFIRSQVNRLAYSIANKQPRFPIKRSHEGFDILDIADLKAAFDTVALYEKRAATAKCFNSSEELLAHAVQQSNKTNGIAIELGVASGATITKIAALRPGPIYGFDSFDGLPEDWRTGFKAGHFAQELPTVPETVTLIKGWFSDTLPKFTLENNEPIAFLHVDCDLYSSTKTAFEVLGDRLGPGSVILFDEYWNYPGWMHHEHKAFIEFARSRNLKYHYDSFVRDNQQVCVTVN